MNPQIENIAYCCLYCAECPNHTGVIADLARDLRKELRTYRFDKTATLLSSFSFFKTFEKYPDCYDVLGAMVKNALCKSCRYEDGNPTCKIKTCVKRKKIDGCWQSDDFQDCSKMSFLEVNHGKAHIKNLRSIKIKELKHFLKGINFGMPPNR